MKGNDVKRRRKYSNLFLPKNKFRFFGFMFTARVSRWYIFKPKILIWVNFGEPWN
jgi:hypothetical protein